MGFTHYFKKIEDVPDEQWLMLRMKVIEVFQKLPSHETRDDFYANKPIIICDSLGRKHIKNVKKLFLKNHGHRFIAFNGKEIDGLDHETFVLRNSGEQECCENFCKTARKPYDWFVTAILILVHNICPNCFEISSDGDLEEWLDVHRWLCRVTSTIYRLPPKIIAQR